jgi:hypothetical protein
MVLVRGESYTVRGEKNPLVYFIVLAALLHL